MNSYDLSRAYFNFSFENPDIVKPIHAAIYFFAIEHCNRLGWKQKFGFPTSMAMEALGIKSYNTYKKSFDDLVEWGAFEVYERSKNQYSAVTIALSKINKANNKALDKALIKHSTKQSESTVQSIDSINKQGTIEQINKEQGTRNLPISSQQVDTLLQSHLTYWNVPHSNERLKMDVWRWLTDEVGDLDYLSKQLTNFMAHTDRKYQGTLRNWMSYKWNETDYEAQGKIIEDADTKYYTYDEMLTIHNDPKKELKQKDFEIVHEKTDHKNRKLWKRKAS